MAPPLTIADAYAAPRRFQFGDEQDVPVQPTFPAPQSLAALAAAARRFQPAQDVSIQKPPLTADAIDNMAADNAARSKRTIAEAMQTPEQKRRVPLFSLEGRQNHPVAYAVAMGSIYGDRAPEAAQAQEQHEREAKEAEQRLQMQEEEMESRREERELRRRALNLPAPSGYERDPVSGKALPIKQPDFKDSPTPPEGTKPPEAGALWVQGRGWVLPSERTPRPEQGPTPPPGWQAPEGEVWVPGKGYQADPNYEKPTPSHAIVGELAGARQRKAKYQQRLTELDDLDAAMEGQAPEMKAQMKAQHDTERAQIKDGMDAEDKLIHDREQELLGRRAYTIDEWNELTKDEQGEYLKAHPTFKPTGRGFDAATQGK